MKSSYGLGMKRLIFAFVALLLPLNAWAQGVVASADPRATEAGREMLRQGGSATDAAMAMLLALTVVEPQSSGIGGGGFLIHHDSGTGVTSTVDGRETAPAAATPDRFLGPDGRPMPFRDAFPGGRSVGVPGNIRLMALAHSRWGRLDWAALFQPAIRLAEEGFEVTRPLADTSRMMAPLWANYPAIAALYLRPDGTALQIGDHVRNPALAAFLRRLAAEGPEAFYSGANAEALVAAVRGAAHNPGDITLADLAAYRAVERPAVCGSYRVYIVCGMGPPSSGATTILQMLGMIERFDMPAMGPRSPTAWHVLGEAMRLAYADREKYLGDADFVPVPVAGLVDPAYLSARSRQIARDRALGTYPPGTPPGAAPRTMAVQGEVPGTTHFVAVDDSGDVVTMTSTVEGPFGSQLVANGYVLNNELTDFTFAPVRDGAPVANAVAPGKRPLSSMSPTIVFDANGRPVLALGSAGGKRIIMHVMKTLVGVLDWNLSAEEALALPNLFFDDNGLIVEDNAAGRDLAAGMARIGPARAGDLTSKVTILQHGAQGWHGAADPRSVGTAARQ